ncbi:NB-ARC domain-containing protein [Amycolatopsis sp. NPDC059090]|uniref:NB-ARC domain-containing protein n=1 Tax=unclassified Amycolatopsis TaxID=2618356 RepID=UPI00366DAE7D
MCGGSNFGEGPGSPSFLRDVYGDVSFEGPARAALALTSRFQAPPLHYRSVPQLEELTRIHHGAADQVAVVLVLGVPGSGRTTLCDCWLYRHRGRFDWMRRVRLGNRPVVDVLAELLSQFGYQPDQMPASLEARSAMWRACTAPYRVGLLVDDVASMDDVRALVPTRAGSCVLVTGLESVGVVQNPARVVRLDCLSDDAARGMLAALAGAKRLTAEPKYRDELIQICGSSATALSVAGALLAKYPSWELGWMVEQIRQIGTSATALFDFAYGLLSEVEKAVYRFFGGHPGEGDVRVDTVVGVFGLDPREIKGALAELMEIKLIAKFRGRYRMADLARQHAATKADVLTSAVIDYYATESLTIAESALPRGWAKSVWREFTVGSLGPTEARSWLAAEHANLIAAAEAAWRVNAYDRVVRLAMALWPLHKDGGYASEMAAVNWKAVRSAHAASMVLAEQLVRTQLGFAQIQRRAWAAAHGQFVAVAELAASLNQRASALESLGLVCLEAGLLARQQGRPDDAPPLLEQAERYLRANLKIAAAMNEVRRLALAKMHLAKVVRPEEAARLLDEASRTLRHEPDNAVKIQLWRGRKLVEAGAYEEGAAMLAELDPVAEQLSMHRERIAALWSRAESALARGYRDVAKAHANDALNIARLRGYTAEAVDLLVWKEQLG